jgi:hypothetical protein
MKTIQVKKSKVIVNGEKLGDKIVDRDLEESWFFVRV